MLQSAFSSRPWRLRPLVRSPFVQAALARAHGASQSDTRRLCLRRRRAGAAAGPDADALVGEAGGQRKWWQDKRRSFRLLPRWGVGGCRAQRGAGLWLGSAAGWAGKRVGEGISGEGQSRMRNGRRGDGAATAWGHAGAAQALRSANPSAAGVRSWPVCAAAGDSASTVATADMRVGMGDVWRLGRSQQAALRPAELIYPGPHAAPGSGVQGSQALWHWIVRWRTAKRVRRSGTSGSLLRRRRGGDRPKTAFRVRAWAWRKCTLDRAARWMVWVGLGGYQHIPCVLSRSTRSAARLQFPARAARTDARRTVGASYVQGRTMRRLRPPRRPRP
jgi:hypothetical protein